LNDRIFDIERYLTICNASAVLPIIKLSKIDLINEHQISEILESLIVRIQNVPIIAISNLNNLSGKTIMQTHTICRITNKGRHVTSHRELFIPEHGAILADNPRMREVGITDSTSGLEITRPHILKGVNFERS
jgi:ribosome biogenesis GTPase / thiamine phosphate phosphatase